MFSMFAARWEVSQRRFLGGVRVIPFRGRSKILVLNLCPLKSFYVLAQVTGAETRVSKDGLILEIDGFSRCSEACFLGYFLCVLVCVSLCFYRKAPWGREDLLFGLGNKIGGNFFFNFFVKTLELALPCPWQIHGGAAGKGGVGWNSGAVTKNRLVHISSDFQLRNGPPSSEPAAFSPCLTEQTLFLKRTAVPLSLLSFVCPSNTQLFCSYITLCPAAQLLPQVPFMVNNGHMGAWTPKCVVIQTGSLKEAP